MVVTVNVGEDIMFVVQEKVTLHLFFGEGERKDKKPGRQEDTCYLN